MKLITKSILGSRLGRRLATCAAAGVVAVAAAVAPGAQAAVVYSGPTAIVVPNNITGIYIDLVTGVTSTTGSFTGFDFNPYSSGGNLNLFYGTGGGFVAPTTAGPASALTLGSFIGSTSTFTTSLTGTNFRVTGTEYVGLRFTNSTTSAINYGWVQLTTTGTTGFPATIVGYAYDNTGGSILAGQIIAVPEPGTVAALGFGALALGASGVRRWRKSKLLAA